jgi:hypothetical protein
MQIQGKATKNLTRRNSGASLVEWSFKRGRSTDKD